jgi:uncharacterized membrane-anchored protein YjiN (DUF445 family)
VELLSKELIHNLLSDRVILSKVLAFIEYIIDDASTKQTLIRLVQRAMIDNDMQQYVAQFVSTILFNVMNNPQTQMQLGELIRRTIVQVDNQHALYILLKQLIDNEKTRELLTCLATDVVQRVLNDEHVQTTATRVAKDILNDTGLQQQSGNFAWNTIKNALKPKWFSKTDATKSNSIDDDDDDEKSNQSEDIQITSDFENSITLPPFIR